MKGKIGVVGFNVLGLAAGIGAFVAASYILSIVCGFIFNLPIISWLLSWPAGPDFYALIAVNVGSVAMGGYTCLEICSPNAKGVKVGGIIYGALALLAGVVLYIQNVAAGQGFFSAWSWSLLMSALWGAVLIGAAKE